MTEDEQLHNEYTNRPVSGGISERHRGLLTGLHRAFAGPFTVTDAMTALGIERSRTARMLAYWASRGWLTRVRRGLYTAVPLEASRPHDRREDPWIIAETVFAPSYVGGWSAAEHWGLTDQIFSDVVVFTQRKFRHKRETIQGTAFLLRTTRPGKEFGLVPVWRGQTRLHVSNPSRTIVDMLNDPAVGGGIRHISEMLHEYALSDHRNDAELLDFANRLRNRAVHKRLGYLMERLDIGASDIIRKCQKRVSAGYSRLDPTIHQRGRLLRRWNLDVNTKVPT